jgi:hypothetical protein
MQSILTDDTFRAWSRGVHEFNLGRYWHAHEEWETGWTRLPAVIKLHVQSMIQIAASLHLRGLGRDIPAEALSRSAVAKQALVEADPQGYPGEVPRIEIDGWNLDGKPLKARLSPWQH